MKFATGSTQRGARHVVPRACTLLLFLAAVLGLAPAAAAQQDARVDASLRRLLQPEVRERVLAHGPTRPDAPLETQPFAGAYSLDTDAAGRMRVAVFMELPVAGRGAILDRLRVVGAEVGTVAGDIAIVRIPVDALDLLPALPVQRLEAARLLHSTHDSSMVATGVNLVRQREAGGWTGMTGAGAIVGVLDSGLDILHPDFRDDGGATRVVGVWDQLVGSTPPPGFTYGFYCTQAAVQAVISTGNLAACPTTDMVGHGTHVAGTAAGSGAAGPEPFRYAGVAPEAELLIVKAGNTTFSEDRVVDGVAWMRQQAQTLGRPVVVNLSLGHQYGPHDGTLLFERMLDALTGPGFVIVAAAGNDGENWNTLQPPSLPRLIHARAVTTPAQAATVQFAITPYTPNSNLCTGNFVDLSAWYATGDRVAITVVRPDGSQHTGPPGTESVSDHPAGRIQIINAFPLPAQGTTAEGAVQVSGCGESGAPAPGTWTIILQATSAAGGNAPVDVYLNNVRLGPGGTATGTTGFDNRFIVASPGNARDLITVGAFTSRNCWPTRTGSSVCYTNPTAVGDIASFSSGGPTRDGRIKPEVTAPGAAVISALTRSISLPPNRTVPGDRHWALEGTSMAAPHVTGAIALLFQQRSALAPDDVREILMRSSRQDAFTQRVYGTSPGARPSDWWGYGKLDVPAALAEVLEDAIVASVAITPAADTIPVGGTTNLRAVATDAAGATVFANYTWTSLDPGVAHVSVHGVVAGVAPGLARIVAASGTAADTALVLVRPPAVLTIHARSAAPDGPVQGADGTLLPLLALRFVAEGPEGVEVQALAVELMGADPDARLVLVDDPDGDGSVDPDARVIAGRTAPLAGAPRIIVLGIDTLVVPANTNRDMVLALQLSGRAVTGTVFTARLLRQGTRTVTANSRVTDRFELAGTLASEPGETTVLRPGELFAASANPVRSENVRLNFAARPTQAAIYTATGSRVVDLLRRFDGLVYRWDLTNDAGGRIVPGVYFLVARVEGWLVRERIVVLFPQLDGGS